MSPSLRRTLVMGTAWMVAMRWAIRLIGLASTLILARLLSPADFGLVAMAALTVGVAQVFLSFGVDMALIQRQSQSREDYDSAWTLRLLQGLAAAIAVVCAIPLSVDYFSEPRLEPVLWALSAGLIFGSFSNIGTVLFRAELQFDREFRFEVSKKVLAFLATIGSALVLKNFWALVIGTVSGMLTGTLLSYLAHPYRPRLCLKGIPRLWSFSQWMLVTNIGYYAESRADELIVGGRMAATQMGFYSMGSEIAALPTAELAMPITRALVPGYAKLQQERDRLNAAFLNAFSMIVLLALPAGIGLAFVAPVAVPLLLGDKWTGIVAIVQILAFHGAIRICYGAIANLFMATGLVRAVAIMTWLSMILFVLSAIAVIGEYGLIGVAAAKLLVNGFLLAIGLCCVSHFRDISPTTLLARIWRPSAAAVAMGAALLAIPEIQATPPMLLLAAKIGLGAGVYTLFLYALWFAAGRPPGPESFIHGQLTALSRRTR